jgi:NAD(P)-dependent dehydrogenase (short-subunit alcohol dehydrogenase family)
MPKPVAARSRSGSDTVALLLADISSQQSVRALVQEFESRHDRLDVLINSVGVTLPRRIETVDGIETFIGTNHLGPFLLTNLLLQCFKRVRRLGPSRTISRAGGGLLVGAAIVALGRCCRESGCRSSSSSELARYPAGSDGSRSRSGSCSSARALRATLWHPKSQPP